MLTEPRTRNGRVAVESAQARGAADDPALRATARDRLERIHHFRLHLAAFLVGMPVVTAVWALTEYMNADGWPDRLSESSETGSWNPWIFWVLLVWGGILVYQGLKAYLGGGPTEADVDREVERMRTLR